MSGPPWTVGQRLMLATFDVEDADLRELDSDTVEVLEVDTSQDRFGMTRVATRYGDRWVDPFSLMEPR